MTVSGEQFNGNDNYNEQITTTTTTIIVLVKSGKKSTENVKKSIEKKNRDNIVIIS